MEPDVVQTVVFAYGENPAPFGDVRRRVTRAGECGAVERAAQENRPVVDGELATVGR